MGAIAGVAHGRTCRAPSCSPNYMTGGVRAASLFDKLASRLRVRLGAPGGLLGGKVSTLTDSLPHELEAGSGSVAFSRTTDTLPTLLLLGQALGEEPAATAGAAPDQVDWPLLVAIASDHLVTPALQPRLGKVVGAPLDAELRHYFTVIRALNRKRNQRIRSQLGDLVGALNTAGIEPILLKGTAHLMLGLYRDDADRVIGDIDLLVAQEERETTLAILRDLGYNSYDGDPEHAHLHHYPPVARHDSEAWVELHKLASPYRRALPTQALIRRARRISTGIGSIAVPCAEDLLIHNIVHSQRHKRCFWSAEFSLRDAYDLVLLARHFRGELDWPRLSSRIAADVGRHSAGFYVGRAHRLFGALPPPLPWPVGAHFADWRWGLHAQGKLIGLQQATRVIAHELQTFWAVAGTPASRRLLEPRWYMRHLRRLRGAAGGWSTRDRLDFG
jgi:Uncharacterised nucleotidyltransferase